METEPRMALARGSTSEPQPWEDTAADGRWSSGAETAIAVIMSVALFASAFLSFLLWLRRRRATGRQGEDDSASVPQELNYDERNEETVFPRPELNRAIAIVSAHGSVPLSELPEAPSHIPVLSRNGPLLTLPRLTTMAVGPISPTPAMIAIGATTFS